MGHKEKEIIRGTILKLPLGSVPIREIQDYLDKLRSHDFTHLEFGAQFVDDFGNCMVCPLKTVKPKPQFAVGDRVVVDMTPYKDFTTVGKRWYREENGADAVPNNVVEDLETYWVVGPVASELGTVIELVWFEDHWCYGVESDNKDRYPNNSFQASQLKLV